MRALSVAVVAVGLFGCPIESLPDGGDGGRGGSGGGSGGGQGAFERVTLDATASETVHFAMAVDPNAERVGVAWFTPRGTQTNVGVPDYDLKYLEWRPGAGVVVGPEVVRFVQRRVGLSLAFAPGSGDPVIAFLGGDDTFVPGSSFFWFQSDAVLATRTAGVWTQRVVARTGGEAMCGNPVSDRGLLVGLWPALAFDGAGNVVFVWRDGHDTTAMDWQGSDVESAEGPLAGTLALRCVNAGGNGGLDGKPAWGGRNQLAIGAGGEPGLVYDRAKGGADTTGNDVWFQRRSGGGWTSPQQLFGSTDTQTGGTLAWDSQAGWGAAVNADGVLRYRSSLDGVSWNAPEDVFGAGSGGWYPSLAMDPVAHEPSLVFYVCSPRANVTATQCQADDDELRVARRAAGVWNEQLVDAEGGWAPKLGFFASGRRVISYRDPRSGVLKLALERP